MQRRFEAQKNLQEIQQEKGLLQSETVHICPVCLEPPPDGCVFKHSMNRYYLGLDALRQIRVKLGMPVNKTTLSSRMELRSGLHQVIVKTECSSGQVVEKEPFYADPLPGTKQIDPDHAFYGIPDDDFEQRSHAEPNVSEISMRVVREYCQRYGPCACIGKGRFHFAGQVCSGSTNIGHGCTCGDA